MTRSGTYRHQAEILLRDTRVYDTLYMSGGGPGYGGGGELPATLGVAMRQCDRSGRLADSLRKDLSQSSAWLGWPASRRRAGERTDEASAAVRCWNDSMDAAAMAGAAGGSRWHRIRVIQCQPDS